MRDMDFEREFAGASVSEKRFFGQYADPAIIALNMFTTASSSILWNMVSYFTDQWKFNYTHAAGIRNIWSGLTLVLPFLLIHVVDTFIGNYYTASLSSVLYTIGLSLLSASSPPASCVGTAIQVSTCARTEKINLYAGLAISGVGLAGIGTSVLEFQVEDGLKQTNNDEDWMDIRRIIFGLVSIVFGILLMLIYFNKIRSWHSQFLIAAVFMGFVSFCFIGGYNIYAADKGTPEAPESRLIVTILRVLVACTSKMLCRHPGSRNLYKGYGEKEPLESTKGLGCLDRAAIVSPGKTIEEQKGWTLCSVTEVEKTKIVFRLFPLWETWIILGVISSMGDTYFLEQANHLEHKLGKLKIPLVALLGFQKLTGWVFGKLIQWACRKCVPESYKRACPAILVGQAMVSSILCCIVSAKVEQRRLGVVQMAGLIDKPEERIPMSIFQLIPQFTLLGVSDSLFNEGSKGFVRGFIFLTMARYIILSTEGIIGIGRIGGVLSVYLVGKINSRNNRPHWFQATLNRSRLDKYYWVLAQLSALSLAAYTVVVCWYFYRESKGQKLMMSMILIIQAC